MNGTVLKMAGMLLLSSIIGAGVYMLVFFIRNRWSVAGNRMRASGCNGIPEADRNAGCRVLPPDVRSMPESTGIPGVFPRDSEAVERFLNDLAALPPDLSRR